ncbi:MAG: tetratricopeptide repeat protein [Candidatus Marinimicrobia bacterium]|jgi:Ca-activated chloride channel family protein|nr:tetratricopeptide repeat protein [Candidatus Neomarinimicrobiota bacterium]
MKHKKNITIKHIIQIAIIILLFGNVLFAEDPGTVAYKNGKYKKAYNYYKYKLDNKKKDNSILSFNTATAAQKLEQFDEAENNYLQSLSSENTDLLSKTEYNLGQISLKKKDLQQALEHFKKSIRYDPNDFDNKAMYETVRKLIEKQKQQDKKQQDKKQKDQKQDQEQNKKQNKDSNKQSKQDQKEEQKQKNKEQNQTNSGDKSDKNTTDNKKMQEMEKKNITKQQAENILDAAKERELESIKKLIRYKMKGKKIKRSKDW